MDLAVLFTASKSRLIRNHNQNGICLVCSLGDKDHQGYILVWVSRVWFLSIYGEIYRKQTKGLKLYDHRKCLCDNLRINVSIHGVL